MFDFLDLMAAYVAGMLFILFVAAERRRDRIGFVALIILLAVVIVWRAASRR